MARKLKVPKKIWHFTPLVFIMLGLMFFFMSSVTSATPLWANAVGGTMAFMGAAWFVVDWVLGVAKL